MQHAAQLTVGPPMAPLHCAAHFTRQAWTSIFVMVTLISDCVVRPGLPCASLAASQAGKSLDAAFHACRSPILGSAGGLAKAGQYR